MRRGFSCLVGVLVLGVCAVSASASNFSYTAQNRSVFAKTHGPGGDPTQTLSDNTTADFDNTAHVQDPNVSGFATQHQQSQLGADTIRILGDFIGSPPAFAGTGRAYGTSLSDVTFTVSDNTPFTLSANVAGVDGDSSITRSVFLSGPGANVNWSLHNGSSSVNMFTSGTLTPGSYHFVTQLDSIVTPGPPFTSALSSVASNFSVVLTPEPASLGILLGLLTVTLHRSKAPSRAQSRE